MNLWINLKKFFLKNKILIIQFQIFIFIILFGALGKIFFSFRDYFWYAFLLIVILIFIFIFFIRKNKQFKDVYFEASNEYVELIDKIEKKPDRYHIDFIIKIISVIALFAILGVTLYMDKNNLKKKFHIGESKIILFNK